jgi:putative SOS response-associated peptidase YedK
MALAVGQAPVHVSSSMCGRYTNRFTWSQLHTLMRLTTPAPGDLLPMRYNIAPTQTAPVVRQDAQGNRTADMLRWGLIPFWADDPGIGPRLINARSEDAASKPSFREAVKKRRCLVPASDFYEWQTLPGQKTKQPWAFRVKGVPVFAFAGLWERWSKGGEPVETFTILTSRPNALVAPIHDRMPVIVRPEMYDLWLDAARHDYADCAPVLEPFPAELMEAHKVSGRVNSPANDESSLIEPTG